MAKILLIAPTVDGDDIGEAWVAYQWASRLSERHDVTLLTYHKRGARPASEQLRGLRVVEWAEPALIGRARRFNSIVKPGYVPFYFRARRWIKNRLREGERYDLVHQPVPAAMRYPSPAAGLGLPLIIGPVGGGLASPPPFVASEESAPWYMKLRHIDQFRFRWDPLLRRTYRTADCVVGIADYVRERLAAIPLNRFEVMSDVALQDVAEPIDRSGRSGAVRLLYAGRLVRTKGAQDAIRAMALATGLPVVLDIVGDGPDRSRCETMIAQLGLGDRVKLHGWRPRSEVFDFYRRADIFVFPSYREPGGNVVLEAMSFSLPLIVIDRGGPGTFTNDLCAIRLAACTPEMLINDLAHAICKLVVDPDLRRRMGAAAHSHARKTALWTSRLDRMDTIYAEVMSRSVSPD
jgi:glycosyltransferase involved in cell wall biosynthesis